MKGKDYERARKRRQRKRIVRFQLMAIFVGVFFVVFIFYNRLYIKNQEIASKEMSRSLPQSIAGELQEGTAEEETSKEEGTKMKGNNQEAKEIWKRNKELLVLVNKENACPKEELPRRIICNGRTAAADVLYSDLCQMLTDAKEEGYNYWIASAYRSAEKQQKLVDEDVRIGMNQGLSYKDALQKTYEETMPAGYSEHQTGLALDILASSNLNMDITQENTAENKWMKQNCHKYGFILRYPKDKEDITKIKYEPWHFRYVGKEAAKYIKKSQLTLEEFYIIMNH